MNTMKRKHVLCISLIVLSFSVSAIADDAAEIPAFGSTVSSMCFLDRDTSTVLPTVSLTEPGTIEGFRLAETTTVLRVVQTDEGEYSIRIGGLKIEKQFTDPYEGFSVATLDLNADGQDEVLVESGQGMGTSVYQRQLVIYRVDTDRFTSIFEVELNDYFMVAGQAFPGGWAKRYRLMREGESGPTEIMLVLETPEVPVSTPDANAQIAMSRREMRFKLDENGAYRLIEE